MTLLDPSSITIRDRQRTGTVATDDLEKSIETIGQIHPITVRRENGAIVLVSGERRLRACQRLNRQVEVQFWNQLSTTEAEIVELEENVKRADLPWRDTVSACGRLHEIFRTDNPDWTEAKTAQRLSVGQPHVSMLLTVYKNINSPLLKDSASIKQSYSILQSAAERRVAIIVNEISQTGAGLFSKQTPDPEQTQTQDHYATEEGNSDRPTEINNNNSESAHSPTTAPLSVPPFRAVPPLVLNTNFLEWIKTYSGPKFSLIHCDFPFDIQYDSYAGSLTSHNEDYSSDGYWPLIETLCNNADRFISYSSHMIFWFSMRFYQKTKDRLESAGFLVQDHPLIWLKSDNSGITPAGGIWPRKIYETAFLCSKGRRPLVNAKSNAYAAPMAIHPIHPSQKSEPMLKHFLSMLIDETTDFFDPTCGSGAALRAADECGARSILGLELDPVHANSAEAATQLARTMRRAAKGGT